MGAQDVTIIAVVLVAWLLVGRVAQRWRITAPMVFVAAGVVLGGPRVLDLSLTSEDVKLVAEITLALLLFSDAARVNLTSLREDIGLPVRLLAIGLPLTILAGGLAAWLIFPGVPLMAALLIGTCLAPTDAGLGAGLVTDERLPSRVRRALNVESGLNDGIATPLVSLAIAILAGEEAASSGFVTHAVRELAIGAVLGIAIGVGGGWLVAQARRRGLSEPGADAVAALVLAVMAYAGAVALEGNGFVAAFVAGLCFGPFRRSLEAPVLELSEQTGQLLAAIVWFLFGAVMLRPTLTTMSWQVVVYAVVSLTVVRMVPVALSLIGSGIDTPTVAFVGWFGPRGMASIVFALLAYDDLGGGAGPLVGLVSLTVVLSVVAHGLSATPLIERYAAHLRTTAADHPVLRPVEVPTARRGGLGHHRRQAKDIATNTS